MTLVADRPDVPRRGKRSTAGEDRRSVGGVSEGRAGARGHCRSWRTREREKQIRRLFCTQANINSMQISLPFFLSGCTPSRLSVMGFYQQKKTFFGAVEHDTQSRRIRYVPKASCGYSGGLCIVRTPYWSSACVVSGAANNVPGCGCLGYHE